MKKIILINLIFLSIAFGGMMDMPMKMMSGGAKAGLSMPIARDMVDESKMFAVDIYTERNYALRGKTYLYSFVENKNKNDKYLSKFLIERSFQLDKDSFIRMGGVAKYENEEIEARIHTLYYDVDFYVNALNIKIGRGVKSFRYGSHFNVIDFLSKNDTIYNNQDMLIEKNSIDNVRIRLNNTSGKNYMSMYIYEQDITDDIDETNYLLEMSTVGDSSKSSIFINKIEDNLSVALAIRKHLGEDTYIKTSIRYNKSGDKDKSLSSSSSITYNMSNNFLIGADYGAWKNDIKADNDSIIFNYIAYAKFKIGNLKVKTAYLKDEKEKTHLSLEYNIADVKLYLDGFINPKDENDNLIRFMISYLN